MGNFDVSVVFVFDQELIKLSSEISVKYLKPVFKEQLHQSTSTFHSFVTIIVPIVQFSGIINSIN